MQIHDHSLLPNHIGSALPLKKSNNPADMKTEAALQKACKNFEAIILQQLLTAMRKSVPKSGLLDSGFSQDMYQSMHDESLAQEMANGKGIGLADALYRQLSSSTQPENNRLKIEG